MSTDTLYQRETFEKWYAEGNYGYIPMRSLPNDITGAQSYLSGKAQISWDAWQAAQTQSQEIISKLQPLKDLSDYLDSRLPIAEEGSRSKQDEWEAAYAFMFKRMNDLLQELRGSKEIISELIEAIENYQGWEVTGKIVQKAKSHLSNIGDE